MKKSIILILGICFLISGCSTAATYKEVFKNKPNFNLKSFSAAQEVLYQATVNAICSRQFMIEEENKEKKIISAKRLFQKGRKTITVLLQAKISPGEENSSNLFLNAIQSTQGSYVADRTRFILWFIPIPGGGKKRQSRLKKKKKQLTIRISIRDSSLISNKRFTLCKQK